MQVITTQQVKTTIKVKAFEKHEDVVADIIRLVVDTGRINNVIVIFFPDFFFEQASRGQLNRLDAAYAWMDTYILQYGAIPDMVWYFDPALGQIVQYGTAVSEKPFIDTAA